MILNIKKRIIHLQLRRFLFLFILLLFIVLLYNLDYFEEPVFGIDRTWLAIGLLSLYVTYYVLGLLRNYHFFLYSDNGSKLIFRFYSLRPLNKRQNSVEIDKATFLDFKIDSLLLGFTRRLHLIQKMPNGIIATYPPINITLLTKKEKSVLNESLKQYKKV